MTSSGDIWSDHFRRVNILSCGILVEVFKATGHVVKCTCLQTFLYHLNEYFAFMDTVVERLRNIASIFEDVQGV